MICILLETDRNVKEPTTRHEGVKSFNDEKNNNVGRRERCHKSSGEVLVD